MKTNSTMTFDFFEIIELYYAVKQRTEKHATESNNTLSYRQMKLKTLMPLLDKLSKELDTYKKED